MCDCVTQKKTMEIDRDEWITWLQAKGLSNRTVTEYLNYFDKFDFSKMGQPYINWYTAKHNNLVARAFLKNLFHYIKISDFPREFKWIVSEFEIPQRTGARKFRIPNVISIEEVYKVANAMKTERNRLMVLVAFYGGLRASELINVKPYDFNWERWIANPDENGRLKVIGKRNKQRGVFIPQEIMARLYQWIKRDASRNQSKEARLFTIKRYRLGELLHDASMKSLGKHVKIHTLRHACGSWLRDSGWDLMEIKEYLGHEDISTTQIYTHISQEKLKDKFARTLNQ